MSAQEAVQELYQKFAPRWIKVIRWREWGQRCVSHQKYLLALMYLPAFAYYSLKHDKFAMQLFLRGATTPEEIAFVKQNVVAEKNPYVRDWNYGEFDIDDMAPMYDLSRRRLEYPEYYEGRYKDVTKTVWGEVLEVKPRASKPKAVAK